MRILDADFNQDFYQQNGCEEAEAKIKEKFNSRESLRHPILIDDFRR